MATPAVETLLNQCCQPDGPVVLQADTLSVEEVGELTVALAARHIQARVIDGTVILDKADLLRELAAAFEFPSYFGNNWDALIDCWSDMYWLPARGYVCTLWNAAAFAAADAESYSTLVNLCQHVAERWHSHDEQFIFKLVLS